MLCFGGTDEYYLMKNQKRVDGTLGFDLKGDLEGNEVRTIFFL